MREADSIWTDRGLIDRMAAKGTAMVMPAFKTSRATEIGEVPRLGDTYRPRPLRFIRRQRLGDWRLKVYGIAMPGKMPSAELVEATLGCAAKILPGIDADRPGIGFVIAHDAAALGIALIYWWQSANELHQRGFTSPRDEPQALKAAWIEDVLKRGDVELYLSRQLDTEV